MGLILIPMGKKYYLNMQAAFGMGIANALTEMIENPQVHEKNGCSF